MKYLEYSRNDLEIINNLAIANSPKKPDPAEGITVCYECGAKYQGKMEGECVSIIPKIEEGWYTRYTYLKKVLAYTDHYDLASLIKKKFIYEKCGKSNYTWEYQNQENDFNDFMSFLRSIPETMSSLDKYSKYLNTQAQTSLINSLPDRVSLLEERQFQMVQALNEIANKINDAGNSLRF